MTIIVAQHEPGVGTWIGCDRRVVAGDTPLDCVIKWSVRKEWAIGCAGDLRAVNIIAAHTDDILVEPGGAFTVAERIKARFEDHGLVAQAERGQTTPSLNQSIIIAQRSTVWDMDCAFGVFELPEGQAWARGSGADYALGAIFALGAAGTGRAGIEAGIRAACALDVSCGGEPWVHLLEARNGPT